eukprot:gene10709-biopygen2943
MVGITVMVGAAGGAGTRREGDTHRRGPSAANVGCGGGRRGDAMLPGERAGAERIGDRVGDRVASRAGDRRAGDGVRRRAPLPPPPERVPASPSTRANNNNPLNPLNSFNGFNGFSRISTRPAAAASRP